MAIFPVSCLSISSQTILFISSAVFNVLGEISLQAFIIFCMRKPRGLQPRRGITPSIFIIIIHLNLLLFNIIYYLYIGNSPNELTKQRNYDI